METVKRTYGETEIDLMEIFQIILSRWLSVVAVGLVGAILAGVWTSLFITKKYTATASLYVYTNPKQTESGTVSNADLAAADNLIKTYQAIVKSNAALKVVSERLNQEHPEHASYHVTAGMLKGATSVNVPTGTKLLEIRVVTADPQLSADIANTFANYVPDEIIRITKAGGVEIVDYAVVPNKASSPSLSRNVVIGLLAGVLVSAAWIVLRALLDTTIYSAEEITKVTNCPVIGNIPHVEIAGEAPEPWIVSVKEEISHGN
ncbi:MAG: hypothetical protein IJC00_03975 [Clostridia bacterium]|nr:hypothetical protein [Clostridia bacterium]